jgi:hypothetical protein
VLDPADQAGEPEPPQFMGHLAGAVGGCSSPVIKARRLLLVMPVAVARWRTGRRPGYERAPQS